MNKQLLLSVGVVLVMAMVMTSCCDSGEEGNYSVKVIYDGEWSGTVGSVETELGTGISEQETVEGDGTKTIKIDATYDYIFASISKGNDTKKLTVQIIVDGEVVKEGSTTEPNGTVSITYKK